MKIKETSLKAICMVVALMLPLGAFAATSTGCEEGSQNEYINPELALCTTHVYNIGGITNPDNAAQREIMRDVIALKTTIMTQQMYKQYEYLDATIKRLKTQLEKAILTTKLQAAGADSSSSSGSLFGSSGGSSSTFRSSDRNIYIAGVSNCNNNITSEKVFECLQSNYNSISNASNNGQNISAELRKQLANDYKVAFGECGVCKDTDKKPNCEDYSKMSQRTIFRECLDELQQTIRKGYQNAVRENRKVDSKN